MNHYVDFLKFQLARATFRYELGVLDFQKECQHKHIAECEYIPSGYFHNTRPPMRICMECRLTEVLWGTGAKVLTNTSKIKHISRSNLLKNSAGLRINEDIKDKLRKKNTLVEIIDEEIARLNLEFINKEGKSSWD